MWLMMSLDNSKYMHTLVIWDYLIEYRVVNIILNNDIE